MAGLTRQEIDHIVHHNVLFRELPEGARQRIASLGQSLEYSPGDVLVEENKVAPYIGLIVEGAVRVSTRAPDNTVELKLLRPGAYFGEVGMLSGRPATATISCEEGGVAIVFEREAMRKALEPYPRITGLLQKLVQRRAIDTIQKTIRFAGD